MEFDPSAISSIPDYAGNPMKARKEAVTLADMMDREQLNKLQLGTAQREEKERAEVDKILKGSDYSTPEGLDKTAAAVNRVSPKAAMDLKREGQKYQSGQIQQELDRLTLASQRQDLIVGAIDPIIAQARSMKNGGASDLEVRAFITQQMPNTLSQLRGMKLNDGKPALPDDVLKMATSVPGGYTLETLEGWEGKSKQGAAAIKQRLEQYKADTQSRGIDERERHDQANEDAARRKADQQGFNDEQKSLLAEMAVRSVNLPAGMRSQQQIKATLDGLFSRNPDMTPGEIADGIKSGKLKLAAETKGAQTAGTQIGKVALAANELDTFGDQTLEASNAVPRGKFVPWGQLKLAAEGKYSDPQLLRFKAKMQALENAYNQLASRSGTDVDKRAHIHELFNTANSQDAVATLVQSLKEEAVGAREAANRTIAETSETAIPGTREIPSGAGGGKDAPSPGAPAASASDGSLQPGKTYKHSSGATVEILE